MNYQAAMFYLTLIMTIVNIGVGISVWWTNRDKITNSRFKVLEDKMIAFESEIKHRPDCQYHQAFESRLDKITVGMAKIEGNVSSGIAKLEGRMEGVGSSLDIIQQHLLNGGK